MQRLCSWHFETLCADDGCYFQTLHIPAGRAGGLTESVASPPAQVSSESEPGHPLCSTSGGVL